MGGDTSQEDFGVTCRWVCDEGPWTSGCGHVFEFNDGEGPAVNGFRTCPYCGKGIEEVLAAEAPPATQRAVRSVRYEITSVADFIQVPAERIEACLEEFRSWHALGQLVAQEVVEEAGARLSSFTWIDDGKREITVSLTFPTPLPEPPQ